MRAIQENLAKRVNWLHLSLSRQACVIPGIIGSDWTPQMENGTVGIWIDYELQLK